MIKCPELRGYLNASAAGSRLAGTDNSRRPELNGKGKKRGHRSAERKKSRSVDGFREA